MPLGLSHNRLQPSQRVTSGLSITYVLRNAPVATDESLVNSSAAVVAHTDGSTGVGSRPRRVVRVSAHGPSRHSVTQTERPAPHSLEASCVDGYEEFVGRDCSVRAYGRMDTVSASFKECAEYVRKDAVGYARLSTGCNSRVVAAQSSCRVFGAVDPLSREANEPAITYLKIGWTITTTTFDTPTANRSAVPGWFEHVGLDCLGLASDVIEDVSAQACATQIADRDMTVVCDTTDVGELI